MDNNKKALVKLLSSAIRGEAFHIAGDLAGVDWHAVYAEAVRHQVAPLLYPLLAKYGDGLSVPGALLEKWRRNALLQGARQESGHIGIVDVLERLKSAGIPVIVLKGLALREIYPHPAFRTMGDADLLLPSWYIHGTGRILEAAGYEKYSDRGKHVQYLHKTLPAIELHRAMAPENLFGYHKEYESGAWERAAPVSIGSIRLLSLCPRDHALYLALHMASHMIGSGFGLRQLCDFVLLAEKNGGGIDWPDFFKAAEVYRIGAFVKALLEACRVLLDMELPETCPKTGMKDAPLVESFIEDIFTSGVFGTDSIGRITANRFIYYNGGLLKVLFPKAEKLDTRFAYARKHRFLLPAAWVHRIFSVIFHRDISFEEKIAVLTSGTSSDILGNRREILEWLELIG